MGGKPVNPTPHRTLRIPGLNWHQVVQSACLADTTVTGVAMKAFADHVDANRAALDEARSVTEPCGQKGCGQPIYVVGKVWYHLETWVPECESPAQPGAKAEPRKRGRRAA